MLRIGVLGAARVAPMAILEPAARRKDVEVVAVAAERPGRAAAFAAEHGIPKAYSSYEKLLEDPDIDLVYNALPPHLHAALSIMALEGGKHVLCEKPFAMNAAEARRMVEAGRRAGRRIIEAFHDRYHPVFLHLLAIASSGQLGGIRSLRGIFNHSIAPSAGEFRHSPGQGGGALMDLGCYPIHWCRSLMNEEPTVDSAAADLTPRGVDQDIVARLLFPSGVEAEIEARMSPGWNMHARFEVEAERGSVVLVNSLLPHRGHSVIERIDGGLKEHTLAGGTTFDYQLAMVVRAVIEGIHMPTEGEGPIGNMATIDAVYAAAGMPARGT
jgi:predicted dehydrogenase